MKTHMILIFLLLLIVLAALFQKPSVGKEHFYGYTPQKGSGVWGKALVCDNTAINLQQDQDIPGRYWGWLPSKNESCAFYQFGNDVLPGYKYKVGNNGSVNCDVFCKGDSQNDWGGRINGCLKGWDNNSKNIIECDKQQGNDMHCICQAGERAAHIKTNVDGTDYNVCINPDSAKPDPITPGRKWGWESEQSCVVLP